jgi:ABC-type branched-subunit amino acid transport system permease subunit
MILMLSAVIGGLGIESGPIVGTVVVVFLHFFLAKYAGWSLLLQGVMLIIVMLLLPRGIMGFTIKKSQ